MFRKSASIVCFLFIIVILAGCGDLVDTSGDTVEGQVVFDVGVASNVTIRIGDKKVFTDGDGKFTINNVVFPYDVSVLYQNSYEVINIYKGLTISHPVFTIGENEFAQDSKAAKIHVYFPIPPQSSFDALIFFKPDNDVPIISYPNSTFQRIDIFYDSRIDTLPGKVIIMYLDYLQQSYYKYYESETIHITDTQQSHVILIDSSEFKYDPDERIVNATIQSPMGNSFQIGYKLAFSNQPPLGNHTSNFIIPSGNNLSMPVPVNIPQPFTAYFFIQQFTSNGDAQGFFKYTEGGNTNFRFHSAPVIVSPLEGDSVNIDNSIFKWMPSDGEGIYRAQISGNNYPKTINVYTSTTDFSISNLTDLGYDPFIYGNDFRWKVFKYFYFSGMDDFVSKSFKYNENYKSFSRSEDINFMLY